MHSIRRISDLSIGIDREFVFPSFLVKLAMYLFMKIVLQIFIVLCILDLMYICRANTVWHQQVDLMRKTIPTFS